MRLYAFAITAKADEESAFPVGDERALMALAYAESESAATELAIKALAEHHWTNAKLDGDVVPVAVDQVEDITLREAAKSAKLYGCALIAY